MIFYSNSYKGDMHYMLQLFLIIFAIVSFALILFNGDKIFHWLIQQSNNWSSSFEKLVRQKTVELGAFGSSKNSSSTKEKTKKNKNNSKVLKIIEKKILFLEEQNKQNNNEYQDLLNTRKLVDEILKGQSRICTKLATSLTKEVHVKVTNSRVLQVGGELLLSGVFIKDIMKDEIIPYWEIQKLILSAVTLDMFIEDIELKKSLITSIIARSKNLKEHIVKNGVCFLLLSKSGASEQSLLDRVVKNFDNVLDIKFLSKNKLSMAKLSVLRKTGGDGFISSSELIKKIYLITKKIDRYKKDYMNNFNRSKKDNKKNIQNKPKSELERALDILGCNTSDSEKTIKKKYKKLVKQKHPDIILNEGHDSEMEKQIHDDFTRIQNAYEILKQGKKAA